MGTHGDEKATGVGRREWLRTGAVASLGSLLAARPTAGRAEPGGRLELPGAEDLVPEKMPKGFSKAEMERRWKKARDWMKREGYDCLLVPARPSGNADVKWLSESAANWVVFPAEGQPTLIFRRRQERDQVREESLVEFDMRTSRFKRSQLIIDRLKELGLQKARIGVGDLSGQLRKDEGGVSYITMSRIKQALPQAKFDSAVDLLMRVKLARGPEEIEVLERVSRVSELGLRAIVETAGVGVMQREVWFNVFKTLLDASGEAPPRISIRAGAEAGTASGRPLNEALQAGQICNQALSGSVLGYLSQVNHSMCIGPPAPADWESAFKYCVDLFRTLVDGAKPGVSFQEYSEFYRKKVEERGEGYWGAVFHTGGPSGDGPRMGPDREHENQDLVMQSGMVFTIKPRIPIKGVEAPAAQIGDPVLITDSGAQRLGRRKLEVISLGS